MLDTAFGVWLWSQLNRSSIYISGQLFISIFSKEKEYTRLLMSLSVFKLPTLKLFLIYEFQLISVSYFLPVIFYYLSKSM